MANYKPDGPMVINPPKGDFTKAERTQAEEYVAAGNRAIREGFISPTGRVSTTANKQLERDARNEAKKERDRARTTSTPYTGIVAHLPDTGWMNEQTRGVPMEWSDHTRRLNSSIAGQNPTYPVGYKPSEFQMSPDWYTRKASDE
jgi:hypothetical protein